MPSLLHVVGARPNFPKLAPVFRAGVRLGVRQTIVHTGQHYDDALSASFFRQLGIPEPHHNLEVGSASHAVQTARVMERVEPILVQLRPDWLVVYGDVNSTMAAALVAAKLGIKVAHVEAGLRSHDRTMPEEINRIVTDRLADLLLTPSRDASEALLAEGESPDKIEFVGNVMIDSVLHALPSARGTRTRERLGLRGAELVVTLHRPSNVDEPSRLEAIIDALDTVADERPVLFPVHPRTRERLRALGLEPRRCRLVEPLPYLEMLDVMSGAGAVATDSGGVQEETTVLGVPCFTLRNNTERPATITHGTNRLVWDPGELPALVRQVTRPRHPRVPEGWDGAAGPRVIEALLARTPVAIAAAV